MDTSRDVCAPSEIDLDCDTTLTTAALRTVFAKDVYGEAEVINDLDAYPSLMAKLTRIPINAFVFYLLYAALQLEVYRNDVARSLDAVKQDMNMSCNALEDLATACTELPDQIATRADYMLNELTPMAVQYASKLMDVTVELTRQVILYIVSAQTSLIRCLLSSIFKATSAALVAVVQQIQQEWNNIVNTVANQIQSLITAVNDKLIQEIGKQFNQIFGTSISTKIPVPNVVALAGTIQISDAMTKDFENAITALPTPDELLGQLEGLITAPFQQAQMAVREGLTQLNVGSNLFSTPPVTGNRVIFCEKGIPYNVVDKMALHMSDVFVYALYGVGTALLLTLVWYAVMEKLTHSALQRQVTAIDVLLPKASLLPSNKKGDGKLGGSTVVAIDLVYAMRHPFLARWLGWTSSTRTRRRFRWFFFYCAHPASMSCFCIGLASLLLVDFQISAIHDIEQSSYQQMVSTAVDNTANLAIQALNAQLSNSSHRYAQQSNDISRDIETGFNNVFYTAFQNIANSVNFTTIMINKQLGDLVDDAFSSVPLLKDGATTLVSCLITSKLDALNSFLQSAAQKSRLVLPTVKDDFLLITDTVLGPHLNSFKSRLVGDNTNTTGGLLGGFMARYQARLIDERKWAVRLTLFGTLIFVFAALRLLWELCTMFYSRQVERSNTNSGRLQRLKTRTFTDPFWHWYRSQLSISSGASAWYWVAARRTGGLFLAILASPIAIIVSLVRWQNIFKFRVNNNRRNGNTPNKRKVKAISTIVDSTPRMSNLDDSMSAPNTSVIVSTTSSAMHIVDTKPKKNPGESTLRQYSRHQLLDPATTKKHPL